MNRLSGLPHQTDNTSLLALFTMSFKALSLYKKLGNRLFSMAFCLNAPYFITIFPYVEELDVGKAVVSMKHRKWTSNHLGTQHAIACCNLVEMTMGCVVEASIPEHLRWIPRGMNVKYLAKATGKLTATSEVDADTTFTLDRYPGSIVIPVSVKDRAGKEVVTADIELYVSVKSNTK